MLANASVAFGCLGALPVAAQTASTAPVAVTVPSEGEPLVVRIKVNSQEKGDFFVVRTPAGDFLIKVEDLKTLGFRDLQGTVLPHEREPHMALRSIRGISFSFDERAVVLDLNADPRLLPLQMVSGSQVRRPAAVVSREPSGFFNYALSYSDRKDGRGAIGFTGEGGWHWGDSLLLTDFTRRRDPWGDGKFVRLMTSLTRDDRDRLQRMVFGDFFTPARQFSNGALLGGVSFSKLYSLNPYLVQFPTQTISGNVALPSELEVYLDGQRIRRERVDPGEFEIRDILAYGGAKGVQLVLRDPFGRVQSFDYSFYFTDQPLRKGLHEYSYDIGAFRRRLGTDSNRYGTTAFSVFHRYGATDWLTLGVRAEGTRELLNGGPSATLTLGAFGLVSIAAARSTIGGVSGSAVSGSYNYQTRNWSLGVSARRDSGQYAVLGEPPLSTNRKLEGNAFISYSFRNAGTVSLNFSELKTSSKAQSDARRPFTLSILEPRRVTSLTYAVPLVSGRASLTASLSHVEEKQARNEAFVGVIVFLDKDHSMSGSVRRDGNLSSDSVQFTRNQPIGEGLGYVVSADRFRAGESTSTLAHSAAQYNARHAIFRGELNATRGGSGRSHDYQVSVAGGLASVGGHISAGRPVVSSFALVQVGQLEGVKVLLNAQEMGTTDSKGQLFIPTLSPYYDSEISVDAGTIPIDYSVSAAAKRVSPSLRSGVVIDFGATRVQSFTGTIRVDGAGPLEYHDVEITVGGTTRRVQTGRGGEFYLENVKDGTYPATATVDGNPCRFDLVIPATNESFVELGTVVCTPAAR